MKKSVFTLFSAVVAAATLAGCSESTVEKVEAPTEEAPAEEAAPAETAALAVGDTVKVDDMQITLNSVRKYTGSADTWDEAANDFYLIFDVVIENTGAEPGNVSSMMNFILYDGDSYAQDMALIDTKGSLDGEVGAGRKMAGEIAFDVVDSETYEFIFEDPFTSGQAIWTIGPGDIQ